MSYKDKFKAILKAKGLSEDDPDVMALVDSVDGDYKSIVTQVNENKAASEKAMQANGKWEEWYKSRGYKLEDLEKENLTYKQKLDALAKAGFEVSEEDRKVASDADKGKYVTPQEMEALRSQVYSTFSSVTKDLLKLSISHYAKYGQEADLDAIEKICAEKGIPAKAAYDEWSAPMADKRRGEDMEKEITRRATEMYQSLASKQGISPNRNRKSEAVTPFVDHIEGKTRTKEKVSSKELQESFINDMYSVEPKSGH